jgi:phosphate transport system substrate-binding protein
MWMGLTFSALTVFAANLSAKPLEGEIRIDGSSTVFPITEAVAEEFRTVEPKVRVTVGVSGTGGGFKKFLRGTLDIVDASRKIKDSESSEAKKNGILYTEFEVALDGIAVVVNSKNTWATDITVEELKKLWEPQSKVATWNDIRSTWPKQPIKLYGPGTDSGTFDYFTEVVNGKAQASRSDFSKSEDDNVLVIGVSGDINALGYFGFAYYLENKGKLKALAVSGGKQAVAPTVETISNGSYAPLSRSLYIYVNHKSMPRPEVKKFLTFYLEKAQTLVKDIGYVPLKPLSYQNSLKKIK